MALSYVEVVERGSGFNEIEARQIADIQMAVMLRCLSKKGFEIDFDESKTKLADGAKLSLEAEQEVMVWIGKNSQTLREVISENGLKIEQKMAMDDFGSVVAFIQEKLKEKKHPVDQDLLHAA